MKCSECYWCVLNKPISNEKVCCNQESENYNKIFTKEETETMECENAETKASRYYM